MKTTLKQAVDAADIVLFQGLLAAVGWHDEILFVVANGLDGLEYEARFIDQECTIGADGVLEVSDLDGDATQLHLFIRMPDTMVK